MSIFSKLFGGQQSAAGLPSAGRWYFAIDNARGLRQIVFELGGIAPKDSQFGSLALKQPKYSALVSDLAVGFFKRDSDSDSSYFLIKTPNFSRAMALEAVRLGFTFCYMPSGPVFAIFAQSPTTEREFKAKGGCFIDTVFSVDKDSGLDSLIMDAFAKETLTVVFADTGGMFGIDCIFDGKYPIEQSLRKTFEKEWANLMSYGHKTRGWGAGSFFASREELYARTPTDKTPILRR